jgi:lipoteichoic acid synthase
MCGFLFFVCVLWYEHIFYLLNTHSIQGFPLLQIAFFVGLSSVLLMVLGYFFKIYAFLAFSSCIFFVLSFYGFSQVSYHRQMEQNYSWTLLFSMFERVQDYAGGFASNLVWMDALVFVPWVFYVMILIFLAKRSHKPNLKVFGMMGLVISLLGILPLMDQSLYLFMQKTTFPSSQVALAEMGSLQFATIGWMAIDQTEELDQTIRENWPTIEEILQETKDPKRELDNAFFIQQVEAESNEAMKEIDHYFLQRPLSEINDQTGLLKNKNLILIMIEAFDYMAIDANVTPTLFSMMNEGWHFDRHYTPQYSCATGESEWIALNSLIPSSSECTPNAYKNNIYPYSLFNLFKNKGYLVTSYHNYSDKFYERSTFHSNMGSSFYNNSQLSIPVLRGWPSDLDLVKQAYPIMTNQQPFMSFLITSSTHFPYDADSTLGNRYLNRINEYYPDYPIEVKRYLSKAVELDLALSTLIEQLKQDDLFEDTLIVLFGDHFPYRMAREHILAYGDPQGLRKKDLNIYLSPLIMYGANLDAQTISTISSTYAILPTLSNLFGLPFDPRLAIGQDLFDESVEHIAFFESLSWISEKGYYSRTQKRFHSSSEIDSEYLDSINQTLQLDQSFSLKILRKNYFAYR